MSAERLDTSYAEAQRTPGREVSELLRRQIAESAAEALAEDDPFLARLKNEAEEMKDLGLAAQEFYRRLIPGSLHPPTKKYEHIPSTSLFADLTTELVEGMKRLRKASPRDFEAIKEEHMHNEQGVSEFEEPIEESELPEGLLQRRAAQYIRKDGRSVLFEDVENLLTGKVNAPNALLGFKAGDSSKSIELNQLLPAGFAFAPSQLYRPKVVLNEDGAVGMALDEVRLESYHGMKSGEGEFFEMGEAGFVFYGDLTERGGLLALLHEIAHAWQDAYYVPFGKGEFKDFYAEVGWHLSAYAEIEKLFAKGEVNLEEATALKTKLREGLESIDVAFDEDRYLSSDAPQEDEIAIMVHAEEDERFIIRSTRFKELLGDYVRQERDAWAHGIRVLRFLRSKGIDLEPELKTLEDFKMEMDPCLTSYQLATDREIEFGAKHRKSRFIA